MKTRVPSRFLCLLSVTLTLATLARAQTPNSPQYFFSTFAGASSAGSADGTGSAARFNVPTGCAMDGASNIYVADSLNKTIRKISPNGLVTTLAGKPGFNGSADGTGNAARFSSPVGIAVDATGNLFVADSENHTIRKITSAGVVTTLAGQAGVAGSTDGIGRAARFNHPVGVALDASGNLYVTDQLNYRVRKITPAGVVSTLAGDHEEYSGSSDGPIGTAQFGLLAGIAVDQAGSVYVTDRSNLRKITPGADVVTLAEFVYFDTPSKDTYMGELWGLTIDRLGNLYTTDPRYGVVGKYSATRGKSLAVIPSLLASSSPNATVTLLDGPQGIAVDQGGNLFVVNTRANTLKKISPTGLVSTIAGLSPAESAGSADGTGASARFSGPDGLAFGPAGELYVADSQNNVIRKITPEGVVTTVAGVAGISAYIDGPLATARFYSPRGVVVDTSGNLFVTDGNSVIRKISTTGFVTTVAGLPTGSGHEDGPLDTAQFYLPNGLALDASGNTFVADYGALRRISASGTVSTLTSTLGLSNAYAGIATDTAGNLYWTVPDSMAINQLAAPGTAPATAAITISTASSHLHPNKIFVDRQRQIYVTSDFYLGGATQVHKVAADGSVQTLAGQPNVAGNTDGFGPEALLNGTQGVAVDRAGNIYVSCITDNTIRKGVLSGPPVISTQPANQSAAVGGSVQFSVTAAGTPAPTYQWYIGGTAFSGATSNTLSFANARGTDAGDYTVVVTNALGSVTSSKATLTISAVATPPQPDTNANNGGGGGGGSIGTSFILALLALGLARNLERK